MNPVQRIGAAAFLSDAIKYQAELLHASEDASAKKALFDALVILLSCRSAIFGDL